MEELDLDKIEKEIEELYAESENEVIDTDTPLVEEKPEEPAVEEEPVIEETQVEEVPVPQPQFDDKYKKVLEELAAANGTSVDDMLERYEETKIQKKAEEQGVPYEFYKRQLETEQELENLKATLHSEKFNNMVESVKSKHNLQQDDIQRTIDFAVQNGLNSFGVDFEQLYRLANMDKIIEQEVKNARQKELEEKQQRQQATNIVTHGGSQQDVSNLDDEVKEFLKEAGLYD